MAYRSPMKGQEEGMAGRKGRGYRDPRSIKMQIQGPRARGETQTDVLTNLNSFKAELEQYARDNTTTASSRTASNLQTPSKSAQPVVSEFRLEGYRMDYDRHRPRDELTPISEESDQYSPRKQAEHCTNSSYRIFKQTTPSPNRNKSAFGRQRMVDTFNPDGFQIFSTIRSEKTEQKGLSPEASSTFVSEKSFCSLSKFTDLMTGARTNVSEDKEIKFRKELGQIEKQFRVAEQNLVLEIESSSFRRKAAIKCLSRYPPSTSQQTYKKTSLNFVVPSDNFKHRMTELTHYAAQLGIIILPN